MSATETYSSSLYATRISIILRRERSVRLCVLSVPVLVVRPALANTYILLPMRQAKMQPDAMTRSLSARHVSTKLSFFLLVVLLLLMMWMRHHLCGDTSTCSVSLFVGTTRANYIIYFSRGDTAREQHCIGGGCQYCECEVCGVNCP